MAAGSSPAGSLYKRAVGGGWVGGPVRGLVECGSTGIVSLQ